MKSKVPKPKVSKPKPKAAKTKPKPRPRRKAAATDIDKPEYVVIDGRNRPLEGLVKLAQIALENSSVIMSTVARTQAKAMKSTPEEMFEALQSAATKTTDAMVTLIADIPPMIGLFGVVGAFMTIAQAYAEVNEDIIERLKTGALACGHTEEEHRADDQMHGMSKMTPVMRGHDAGH